MKDLKIKLVVSFVAVLLSIALIAGASMAWMSISTNPEIAGISILFHVGDTLLVKTEDGEYTDTVDLSALIADYSVLKPVSTADLQNWFIPQYDDNGELKDPEDFILDTTLSYANQPLLPDTTGMSAEAAAQAILLFESHNYYAYCDVWLKCEDLDGCTVRLSVPHYADLSDAEGELDDMFGSYVLPKYEVYEDINGVTMLDNNNKAIVGPVSNFAETAFRVGFLVYGDEENPDTPTGYAIYEPNADKRSNDERKLDHVPSGDEYVYGYTIDEDTYLDGYYFKTKPIGLTQVTEYKEYTEVPGEPEPEELYVLDGSYIRLTDDNRDDYPVETYTRYTKENKTEIGPVEIDKNRLIVQKQSSWDYDKLREAIMTDDTIDSTLLSSMGRFLSPSDLYSKFETPSHSKTYITDEELEDMSDDIAGNNVIFSLDPEEEVRVRLFFWIEGQDVDCWNDISSGTFVINLELAGKSK